MFKKKSYQFLDTSLALSSSLPRVVTSSLRSSKLSRSCRKGILYQFYNTSHFAVHLCNAVSAGSLSAIYNIHLGLCHPDIPKLFWPPLSRPVPHILCLLLTLHTTLPLHSKPVSHSKSIVCAAKMHCCIPLSFSTLTSSYPAPPKTGGLTTRRLTSPVMVRNIS